MAVKKNRVNEAITSARVRLIDAQGNQLGIVTIAEALIKAKESALDLVEVSPNDNPPVCRILDYGKFKFSKAKKSKSSSQRKLKQQLKEIKFRPNIDIGDYKVKLNRIVHFLERGDRVKITLTFRGREMLYKEKGLTLLSRLKDEVEGRGAVEQEPKLEGRQIFMVVVPKQKKGG